MATLDQLKAMQALEKRGKLPEFMRSDYDDAVKKGLIRETGPRAKAAPKEELSGSGFGSFMTSIPEGIPIAGPYVLGGLQRAGALGRSWRSGRPYEEELKTVQEMTSQAQQEHPYLSTAGHVAGAVAGLAPLAATGPGAAVLGMRGGLLARSAAAAGSGGVIGGADTAARGGSAEDIAWGAGLGTVGGVVSPAIGDMVGTGIRTGMNAARRPGGPLSAISRRAANYAADVAPSAGQAAELQRLGPNAMLADIPGEWQAVARGAATRPGNRDDIVQALLDRRAGANQRLGQDLDTSLGAVRNPVRTEAYLDESRRALGPEYERAARAPGVRAVDTQGIADTLDTLAVDLRGGSRQAVQRVRDWLNIPGQQALDPNPTALLNVRHEIDGLIGSETNRTIVQRLQAARRLVDAEVARAIPGVKDIDAAYAELARQSEGLTRGSQVLDSGKTAIRPEDLAEEMQRGALPQGTQVGPSGVPMRMREGARAEIDRIAGTSANDAVALQRLVKGEGDWNRDKLRTLFGPQADDALNAIDREATFNNTTNRVTGGSDTAMASRFGDFLDEAASPPRIPPETSAFGFLSHTLHRGAQKMLGTNAEATARRFASELGRASVATGADRDALVAALQDYARRRALGQPVSSAAARWAQRMLYGGQEVPTRIYLNVNERDRQMGGP